MKKIPFIYITGFLFVWILVACQQEETEASVDELFGLTETSLTFSNTAGTKSVEIIGITGDPKITVETDQTGWCTATLSKEKEKTLLSVSVEENLKVESRRATIELTDGIKKRSLLVLQTRKIFETVAPVKELAAQPLFGEVLLTWQEPEEDNFHHLVISTFDNSRNLIHSKRIEKGTTSYTITGLLSSEGEYLFEVQSFDKENEAGEIAGVRCAALKQILFKFSEIPPVTYIGYFLRTNDEVVSRVCIGSSEYNENETVVIKLGLKPSLIDDFNEKNGMQLLPMPDEAYVLSDFTYRGTRDFEEFELRIRADMLDDRTTYAIPLEIISASGNNPVSDTECTALLIFRVDDLEGWYTVERLPRCGEPASAYPAGKRRFIKRTGEYTWETGYLFRTYAESEETTSSGNNVQYITLDPVTKKLHIQQGAYQTAEDKNVFDLQTNELTIEYLYLDYSDWWTHERMFNRSDQK